MARGPAVMGDCYADRPFITDGPTGGSEGSRTRIVAVRMGNQPIPGDASRRERVRKIAGRYVKQILDHDVPGLAAELAYRFMFATFPFAIFVVALSGFIANWLGVANPGNEIIRAIGSSLPSDVVGPVKTQLDAALAHTEPQLLSIGAVVTVYAAAGGVNTLTKAMNRAYGVRETRPLALRLGLGLLLTFVGGVAIVVSFVAIVGGTLATQRLIDQVGLTGVWPAISLLRWPVALV